MARCEVDIVVTVKSLAGAKSRLLGAADNGTGDRAAHESLTLAIVRDTVAAAIAVPAVRRLLVITSDSRVARTLAKDGIATEVDAPADGLNAAVSYGADLLRHNDPHATVAALQSDLPALRHDELAAALAQADGRRAFCADRHGTGTTLLIAAPGHRLDPRFGPGSAHAHTASGAIPIGATLPSLRCDVDTEDDLAHARAIGLGPHTSAAIGMTGCRGR
jgi:2-phospho-L-lactate guanylyltransferase